MKYDFDTVINRRGTASEKWDMAEELFRAEGILPMWVADMDFASPPAVVEALEKRARHGIYGYTACMPSYFDAVAGWMKRRQRWTVKREWLLFCPGVVSAVNMIVQSFTAPGDKVILQTPVYYPFLSAVTNNGREILRNPLVLEDGRYRMDFEGLERAASDQAASLLILCSPHNPVGRCWSRDELTRLGEICAAHKVLVASDEIHGDLVLPGNTHTPFAALGEPFLMRSVTCTSPSKTFNLPGLQTSNLVIADEPLRVSFMKTMERNGLFLPNAFGPAALEAAYVHGGEWLDELLDYLKGNLEYLKDFVRYRLPDIKVIEPEATYLVWLDFRALGLDRRSLKDLLRGKARVALDEGYIFGTPEGEGFERMNIACPRSILKEGLERIERALHGAGA